MFSYFFSRKNPTGDSNLDKAQSIPDNEALQNEVFYMSLYSNFSSKEDVKQATNSEPIQSPYLQFYALYPHSIQQNIVDKLQKLLQPLKDLCAEHVDHISNLIIEWQDKISTILNFKQNACVFSENEQPVMQEMQENTEEVKQLLNETFFKMQKLIPDFYNNQKADVFLTVHQTTDPDKQLKLSLIQLLEKCHSQDFLNIPHSQLLLLNTSIILLYSVQNHLSNLLQIITDHITMENDIEKSKQIINLLQERTSVVTDMMYKFFNCMTSIFNESKLERKNFTP